jgi:hypothetical protein
MIGESELRSRAITTTTTTTTNHTINKEKRESS